MLRKKLYRHPDYIVAKETAMAFKPLDGCNYSWIYAYVLDRFNFMRTINIELDAKANRLVRYYAIIIGLIGVIYFKFMPIREYYSFSDIMIGLSICSLIIALLIALWVSRPKEQSSASYSMGKLNELLEKYKDEQKVKGIIAVNIDKAVCYRALMSNYQGKLLKYGYVAFILSMIFLTIGIITAMFYLKNEPELVIRTFLNVSFIKVII